MATAIVGANWGDEGKGKMTDLLAANSDIVVRFQGGSNAGHTIINQFGRFALHLLPSGSFNPDVTNVIGPGVALNIRAFAKELDDLHKAGIFPKIIVSGPRSCSISTRIWMRLRKSASAKAASAPPNPVSPPSTPISFRKSVFKCASCSFWMKWMIGSSSFATAKIRS